MTNYVPPAYGQNTQDFFTGAAQPDNSTVAARALRDYRNETIVAQVPNRKLPNGTVVDNSMVREVTTRIHNYAGGLNRVRGTARQGSAYYPYSDLDRFARSSLLTNEPGVLSLAPLKFSNGATLAQGYPAASAYVFNLLAMIGVGGTTLRSTTSQTDATPVAITFSGGQI